MIILQNRALERVAVWSAGFGSLEIDLNGLPSYEWQMIQRQFAILLKHSLRKERSHEPRIMVRLSKSSCAASRRRGKRIAARRIYGRPPQAEFRHVIATAHERCCRSLSTPTASTMTAPMMISWT